MIESSWLLYKYHVRIEIYSEYSNNFIFMQPIDIDLRL